MDQQLLPQSTPNEQEGESIALPQIIYEVQRFQALGVGVVQQVIARERGDYWRVAILDSAPVAANTPALLISQGINVWGLRALELHNGGTVRFPAVENQLTIENIGNSPLDVVVIMVAGFEDDYQPGVSLL